MKNKKWPLVETMEKYSYSIFAYHFVIDIFVLVEIFWILMDSKIEN